MNNSPDLRLLFATNFSDSCFRAIRAIAQLADTFRVDVTIAYIHNPGRRTEAQAERELYSFFAEADHYGSCRRLLLKGDAREVLSEMTWREPFDLVMAPASDRLGLVRLFHNSLRAGLLRTAAAPLWTASAWPGKADFRRPIQTIACSIDFDNPSLAHLEMAASLAARLDARLRLMNVVPVVNEGTLAAQSIASRPLHPDVATDRIQFMLRRWSSIPEIDVAIGREEVELPRLAARCEADLLFLGSTQAVKRRLYQQMHPLIGRVHCPVICIDSAAAGAMSWTFERPGHRSAREVHRLVAGAR